MLANAAQLGEMVEARLNGRQDMVGRRRGQVALVAVRRLATRARSNEGGFRDDVGHGHVLKQVRGEA